MSDFTFTRQRGDTIQLEITLTLNGAALPIANLSEIWFTAKKKKTDADPGQFQKTMTAGAIVASDGPNGKAIVTIAPADTSALTVDTLLYCDVQVKETGSGRVTTVLEGTLKVELDITRAS